MLLSRVRFPATVIANRQGDEIMEVVNEKIGIKLVFDKAYEHQEDDENAFYKVTAISTITECHSEKCYSSSIKKHQIGAIVSDFLFSETVEDASTVLKEINEVAVMDYICNKRGIIENICISLSFCLTEEEKVLVIYGEANCRYQEMLEYGDVSRDLHKYSRMIPCNKVLKMSDYEIQRYFVLSFLNTLQRCSLDCKRENPFAEELEQLL